MTRTRKPAAPEAPAPQTPPPAEPARRPRGRPRKTALEIDDGNRRRALMDCAAELFLTQGYAATSVRDIAAAVGMHSGSPFYFFKSKSDLLHAVMHEGMLQAELSQQQAMQALAPDTPIAERLRTLIRHHFEVLLGPRSGFIPVMLYEWRSLTAVQRNDVSGIKDRYEAVWAPVLEQLHAEGALQADPGVARLYIFGALHWAVQWFSPRKGMTLDQLSDQAMALFIRKD